jgi:hypothetical protein
MNAVSEPATLAAVSSPKNATPTAAAPWSITYHLLPIEVDVR